MLKQSTSRMKKVLAILLGVLFIVSFTAVAASAHHWRHGGWGVYGWGLPGPVWGFPISAPAYIPVSAPAQVSVCAPVKAPIKAPVKASAQIPVCTPAQSGTISLSTLDLSIITLSATA